LSVPPTIARPDMLRMLCDRRPQIVRFVEPWFSFELQTVWR